MRSLLLPLVLLAGCFSPKLGSPGYYCHLEDNPACPDGQQCVDGRCQSPGVHLIGKDGGDTNPPLDMTGNTNPPLDMTMPITNGMTGCKGYGVCLLGCTDTTCQTACDNNVTANGMTLWGTALGCGQTWCLNSSSPRACKLDSTGMTLVDATGQPTGTCNTCLNNALAALTGAVCPNPGSANCNPSSCTSDTNACLASTP